MAAGTTPTGTSLTDTGTGSGQNGPRPGVGAGSGFSLAAAAPLAQIRSPGPGMDRRAASSIQRRISRGSAGGVREDGLALVPRDVGARLKSLQDEVRDVRRENQRLREGISKEEIQSTSGKGGELENHLLRHALKKTKEELHEERTILAQNRETHLLQQLERVMQEKTKLSAMVDELTQENHLLKDKVEYLQSMGTPKGKEGGDEERSTGQGFRLGDPREGALFGEQKAELAVNAGELPAGAGEGAGWTGDGSQWDEGWGEGDQVWGEGEGAERKGGDSPGAAGVGFEGK